MSLKKRLIVTFDAFGTLFRPREPIAVSYARIARECGLSGFSDAQINKRFRSAFKQESWNNPNYGKGTGMGARRWWSNVIHNTFHPYASSTDMSKELVPSLLSYFGSSKGYMLYPDVEATFQLLRKLKIAAQHESSSIDVSVGIISNSDNRVLPVLSSLGLSIIRPAGAASSVKSPSDHSHSTSGKTADIDFSALSYDIGFEKPSQEIFDAARNLGNANDMRVRQEKCIHVGDDLEEDFKGAEKAGWKGLLLDRKGRREGGKTRITDLSELEPHLDNPFSELRRLRSLKSMPEMGETYRKVEK